ncbi:hypothetical protein GT204_24415 [Streptomyces sp. SID4919]|uniref:hypothetical protein n=1 Tax=unclassified Streptomyces TaxID=2593676 RepID=UPI0008239A6A|nr:MULTISPECIES: hypothetical protein [unclassified Streptomyces]MYY11962.1 hypothetical protein [Streptomyces sp. SID4919]SCK13579.1 hypothetical protein YW7DRAFT_00855 [Streptomyces sp. AmelKG-E11A]
MGETASTGRSRRQFRSATVVLGGMGLLAAALTGCSSEPDKRCVDRDSYESTRGYKVVKKSACSDNTVRTNVSWYTGGTQKDGWVREGSLGRPLVSGGSSSGGSSPGTSPGTSTGTSVGTSIGASTGVSSGGTDSDLNSGGSTGSTSIGSSTGSDGVDRGGFGSSTSGGSSGG